MLLETGNKGRGCVAFCDFVPIIEGRSVFLRMIDIIIKDFFFNAIRGL